jgi:hypothetical protein
LVCKLYDTSGVCGCCQCSWWVGCDYNECRCGDIDEFNRCYDEHSRERRGNDRGVGPVWWDNVDGLGDLCCRDDVYLLQSLLLAVFAIGSWLRKIEVELVDHVRRKAFVLSIASKLFMYVGKFSYLALHSSYSFHLNNILLPHCLVTLKEDTWNAKRSPSSFLEYLHVRRTSIICEISILLLYVTSVDCDLEASSNAKTAYILYFQGIIPVYPVWLGLSEICR